MFFNASSDTTWLNQVAGGDSEALAALYDRYAEVLMAICHEILGPSSEADELLHDVFLDVWRSAHNYSSQQGSVRAWLILRCREMALEQLHLAPELGRQGQSQQFIPSDWAPTSRYRPLALRDPQFGQDRSDVQRALHHLPIPLRQAAEAHFFCGLTLDDMAAAKNVSREAAAVRISRAYAALHRRLHEPRRL